MFNKTNLPTIRKARRTLGECDGIVWHNQGVHKAANWVTIYYAADKDGQVTKLRKTIYWSTNTNFAIVHYRGENCDTTPKKRAKGRPIIAVEKANNIQNVNTQMLIEPEPEGEIENIFDTNVPRGYQIRERAKIRPIEGERKFHKADVFNNQLDSSRPLTVTTAATIFNLQDETIFLDCDQFIIADPKPGEIYAFKVPEHMQKETMRRDYGILGKSWEKHIFEDGFKWSQKHEPYNMKASYHTKHYLVRVKTDKPHEVRSALFRKQIHYSMEKKKIIVHYLGTKVPEEVLRNEQHQSKLTNLHEMELNFHQEPEVVEQPVKEKMKHMTKDEMLNLQSVLNLCQYDSAEFQNLQVLKSATMINDAGIEELRKSMTKNDTFVFQYDTSIRIDDNHIGILSAKHNLMQYKNKEHQDTLGQPLIPIAAHIFSQDQPTTHINFLNKIHNAINQVHNTSNDNVRFHNASKTLITNRDHLDSPWLNQKTVFCWNSILKDVKTIMQSFGLAEHYPITAKEIVALAKSSTRTQFDESLSTFFSSASPVWTNEQFKDYFINDVKPKIEDFSGAWNFDNSIGSELGVEIRKNNLFLNTLKDQSSTPEIVAGFYTYSQNQLVNFLNAYYNHDSTISLKPEFCHLSIPKSQKPELRAIDINEFLTCVEAIKEKNNLQRFHMLPKEEIDLSQMTRKKATKTLIEKGIFKFNTTEKRCLILDPQNNVNTVWYGERTGCSCETPGYCAHICAVMLKQGIGLDHFESATDKQGKPNKKFPSHPQCVETDVENMLTAQSFSMEDLNDEKTFRTHTALLSRDLIRSNYVFTRPDISTESYNKLYSKTTETVENPFESIANYLSEMNQITEDQRMPKTSWVQNKRKLEIGHVETITINEINHFALRCLNNREIILASTTTFPNDAISFAARSVQHQTGIDDNIMVGLLQTDNPAVDILNPRNPIEWKTFKPMCHCREPTNIEAVNTMLKCKKCPELFHLKCIPPLKRKEFLCACCKLAEFGCQWGAGSVKNTCTIDNALTSFVLDCKENTNLYKKIRSCKYSNKNIQAGVQKTIEYAMKNQWSRAQETWNSMRLLENPNHGDVASLEGSPQNQLFSFIPEGGIIQRRIKCTSCNFKDETARSHILFPRIDVPIQDAIQKAVENTKLENPCQRCHSTTLTQRIVQTTQIPWYLHFDMETTPFSLRECLDVPKYITLPNDVEYKLSNITLSTPGHFTAVIYSEDQFLYYDGLNEKKLNFVNDTLLTNDYKKQIVNSITYTVRM